jgi:manganese/zinc/iron transport system substrate-binding protein
VLNLPQDAPAASLATPCLEISIKEHTMLHNICKNKIFPLFPLTAALFVALALFACNTSSNHGQLLKEWMTANGKIKVLSTVAMIDDLVKQVGGDFVDTTVLIKGELDPHSYQLVKGDDEKFAFADLIFANGLGLEHGPSLQSYLAKSKKVTSLGNAVMDQDPNLVLYYKGQLDPHIWMDIGIWSKTVPFIVEAMSQKDPAHAANFKENGAKVLAALEQADKEIRGMLQEVPASKRYLVTSHDAFNYFTRSYLAEPNEKSAQWRKRFVAPEGLAPESQISTTDIQAIIDHLSQYKIHIIFPESNVNRDSIRKIVQAAKENGLDVKIADAYLYADAMGKPGSDGDSYIKMISHNAKTLAAQLKTNGG